MKILALTNLFPPHHAGTYDFRCQRILENLKLRGHEVRVLTSTCGLRLPQCDAEVERKLKLNGFFGQPLVTGYSALHDLELANHQGLRESLAAFQPDLVQVFSLRGLSKSLLFTLRHAHLPTVFDIADGWLSLDLGDDPWLKWWNHPGANPLRRIKEMTGVRARLDAQAPTRMMQGYDRIPELYGGEGGDNPPAKSISAFRFERLYFCSQMLKQDAEQRGFAVNHAEVIYPGIATETFVHEVRPASVPTRKLLVVARLTKHSGVLNALKALQLLRPANPGVQLSVYGKGDSDYIAELRSLAALQRLPVEFLPVSNQGRDLLAIYRQHEVLLYTNEEPEPFSLIPLEAMACGLAVIGTPIGGVGELYRAGENALTFTPGDATDLSARIQELLAQPALRQKLAETAQEEVLSQHSETAVTDRIENCLETARQTWQSQ